VTSGVISIGIDPEIELGPITLAWHGITIAIGILIGGLAVAHDARRRGLDTEPVYAIGLILVVGALVGGRVYLPSIHGRIGAFDPNQAPTLHAGNTRAKMPANRASWSTIDSMNHLPGWLTRRWILARPRTIQNRRTNVRVIVGAMALRGALLPVLLIAGALAGCGGDTTSPSAERSPSDDAARQELRVSKDGWRTDFSRHSVALGEFISGGPPRDGIPPIDEPKPVPVRDADEWLEDREPVLVVEVAGEVRAYPVQILVWHEIVNDRLGGRPIAVTYCPLCNSSLVFDREVEGVGTLRLGTTGNLRHSDLVMWDDHTESWWQQLTGEAVVGELTGTRLEVLPSQTLSWDDFKSRHPDADVLSRDTGHDREYGANPYEGYDDPGSQPFLLEQPADRRLPPKERVVAIQLEQGAVVVPFSRLARDPVAEIDADGVPVVVLYKRGVLSPLDNAAIGRSRDVGTAGTFDRRLDGRTLNLVAAGDGQFRDRQTGSTWDITGQATAGPLAGRRLRPVISDQQFWFALAAFLPDARIVSG
jgi:hypothetical protein